MKTYLVFHIVGYTKWAKNSLGQDEMVDKVILRLIDTSPENALNRAQAMIKRDQWLVAEVVEFKEDK